MSKVSIKTFFLSVGILISSSMFSQSTEQILEVGHEYFKKGDYLGASEVYQQAMNIDSSDAAVLYHYSKSLMELMQMEKASRYLFKASLIDKGEIFPDIYYLLAESYRSSGDYRKARRYYSKAIIPYRSDRKSYWYKRIDQSKNANNWAMKQPLSSETKLNPFDTQFNTDASEFGARILDGQLYYSSLKADSIKEKYIVEDLHYFNRIYHADLNNQEVASVLSIPNELQNQHLANLCLSEDTRLAYFSVCDTNYICEIWQAELKDNQLLNPKALNKNINFPNYTTTQPEIISYKGKEYLLFSSNRPKGFGEMDLWISERKEFGFDEAINLGSLINTPGNEITPFYKDGWLYFSSNWHAGFGGYDIFKTTGWISHFQEPQNLGNPINSASDDYYFSRTNDQAIVTSNRPKEGSQDICCNDLYFTPYSDEIQEQDSLQSDTVVPDLVMLNKYLPLDLYFHNDMPDPNSKDSTTSANYILLAEEYLEMKEEYLKQIGKSPQYVKDEEFNIDLESFFENEISSGLSDLEFFTPLLLKSLESGNQIELSIKGFASSLSGTEYNLKLTLRRIESLINYFKDYNSGVFLPYLNKTAENGGSLSIRKIPFGEFAISDKSLENDKILAVYSPQAAAQRKIELIAVSKQDGELKKFDSQEGYQAPVIKFNSRLYELGRIDSEEISRSFVVSNSGGSVLEIYNIMINCECAQIEYPSQLQSKEEGVIKINIDSNSMKGNVELIITVVSNTTPNLNDLRITLQK